MAARPRRGRGRVGPGKVRLIGERRERRVSWAARRTGGGFRGGRNGWRPVWPGGRRLINPSLRAEVLLQVRAQVEDFARRLPGFDVLVDDPDLPTEYELRFTQRSLGPGPKPGDEPVPIDDHQVVVVLGVGFPQTPPVVYWESPIFHPNIFPNYDSEPAREQPEYRGLVCLGALADHFTPGIDFGDLCQVLVDMAAFRNVSVFGVGDDARIRANFYDKTAAIWIARNPEQLDGILGRVPAARPQEPGRNSQNTMGFQNTIEPVEDDAPGQPGPGGR